MAGGGGGAGGSTRRKEVRREEGGVERSEKEKSEQQHFLSVWSCAGYSFHRSLIGFSHFFGILSGVPLEESRTEMSHRNDCMTI